MNLADTDPHKKPASDKPQAAAKNGKKAEAKAPAAAPAPAAAKAAAPAPATSKTPAPSPAAAAKTPIPPANATVVFEASPIPSIPPPRYTFLDRITPGGRRRRQLANMESGFRQILGLVQSMRENQQLLFHAFQKLPEAVDSVKKLADHSAQQAELLQQMNNHMGGGTGAPLGKFNETLASMDKTTQLLLERAQRSEERLYGMLRRAQRRITVMTLLVILTFAGGLLYVINPEQTRSWIDSLRGNQAPANETPALPVPLPTDLPVLNLIPPTPIAETNVAPASEATEQPTVEPTALPTSVPTPLPTVAPTPIPPPPPTPLPDVSEAPEVTTP